VFPLTPPKEAHSCTQRILEAAFWSAAQRISAQPRVAPPSQSLRSGSKQALDTGAFWVDTPSVGALPNRLHLPDARNKRAYLQVTRHGDQRKLVFSQWRDGVCVASTPVEVSELPALIGVLAEALGDAAAAPPAVQNSKDGSFWGKLRRCVHPTPARIVELPHLHDPLKE
jgi:hypothetical protein